MPLVSASVHMILYQVSTRATDELNLHTLEVASCIRHFPKHHARMLSAHLVVKDMNF
jgi:hypothetical protein